ncbi:(4Fe-4S)-binding protein [Syntrophotalea acetylenivorans]|uniref:(4Fe-4S)-binding protein n=1 Tax=Syntrophotalea acetylenivorans TaxID=1842532 RepID=A0A1L3GP12_9BACT|nr:ATP-binding protein [Syntrophotalea acetylenivorans]APG27651.1 (4Fe-4S)-binding protein [Syntrophotalea acetylenivorans]
MKELVIISGKGGTGKTSVAASFAALAENAVVADCDVDAADLHLVLEPQVLDRHDFSGGFNATVRTVQCSGCGTCLQLCRFGAVNLDRGRAQIDPIACEGCGVCSHFCPEEAIDFSPSINGQWFLSTTCHGPMVHARLGIAQENSGKLVSLIRKQAKQIAANEDRNLIIIDGSPGIGCPVIASLTGADQLLAVTEPTMSGRHDLKRVADLAAHFGSPLAVCINKWDLNPDLTRLIEDDARQRKLPVVGRIRYDRAVTDAQIHRRTVVEHTPSGAATDIKKLWQAISTLLSAPQTPKNHP